MVRGPDKAKGTNKVENRKLFGGGMRDIFNYWWYVKLNPLRLKLEDWKSYLKSWIWENFVQPHFQDYIDVEIADVLREQDI